MSVSKGNVQISIHAGLTDTSSFDASIVQNKVYKDIVEKYHKGGVLRKIFYYFMEKEVKQDLQKKHTKKLKADTKHNLFFHPERTAFAHRSNISFHYKLGDGSQKRGASFTHEKILKISNDYILGTGEFSGKSNDEANALFTTLFTTFVKNNKDYQNFKKANLSKGNISSDLLHQLKAYRANIELLNALLGENGISMEAMQKMVVTYVSKHQQLPLLMRMLDVTHIDSTSWETFTSEGSKAKLQELLKPIYDIHLTVIAPTTSVGSLNISKGQYSSILTRLGLGWKWLPGIVKILVIAGVVVATALLGGWTILALPLFIFVKQILKTKADYIQNLEAYLNRFVTNNKSQKDKKALINGKKSPIGKSAKDTKLLYTSVQPNLLTNPIYASELAKNILINAQSTTQQQVLKQQVDVALGHIAYGNDHKVPTYVVQNPATKEQETLLLYKAVVLGSSLVGYKIHTTEGINEYKRSRTFQNFMQNQAKTVKKSRTTFHRHSRKYALRDGLMSGVVAGFTSWLGGYLWTPGTTAVSAYASSELVELTVNQDSPLYQWLLDNDMNPSSTEFNSQDIDSMLEANSDVRIEGEQLVYSSDAKVLDVQLIDELKSILPEDTYDKFIEQLLSDDTATLWDTMTDIAGSSDGNMYSHKIVEQIWKADVSGSSEIFVTSIEKGLPVSDSSASQWDDIMKLLNRTYNYDGFEMHQQWVDKAWLTEAMGKLSENNFSVEEIDTYSKEQRDVLTHAAFINIDTNDIKDILLDYSGQEEVIGSITPVGSDSLLGGDTSGGYNDYLDTPKYTGELQSTPLPFGKNTFIAEPKKATMTAAKPKQTLPQKQNVAAPAKTNG